MLTTRQAVTLFWILIGIAAVGSPVLADSSGKQDYMANCARCHGANGKGEGAPQMRTMPGYVTVDLTQLSERNDGQFPRQKVYDAIDGRERFPAHFKGGMPVWGLEYQPEKPSPKSEEIIKHRISALVNYIDSIQEKPTGN
jgi:mono/diheme cytochrome c family protein